MIPPRRTVTFTAIGEDGRTVQLDVWQRYADATTMGDRHAAPEPTTKALKLRDGTSVNRIEKGKYKVFDTDEILTSDDPNAI